jgi:DNA-binding MarR family transcriptional regulator
MKTPLDSSNASPQAADPRIARAVRSIACVSRAFEQVCRIAGLSLPQYRLLLFLRHGPKRAGELALQVAIKRPTLTALVDGLAKEGYLRRIADEEDGRGVRIEITHEGSKAFNAAESQLGEVVIQLCDLGEYESLLGALDDLATIVDQEFARLVDESTSGQSTRAANS